MVITVAAIAAVSAITVGVLVLAGVGDGETSEERINRIAKDLAADTLRESPTFCDQVRPASFIDVVIGFDALAAEGLTLSGEERHLLSDRFVDELQRQCRERSR